MKLKATHNLFAQSLILVLISFLLYANTLGHQWASDDTMLITQNDFTHEGWQGIKKIWTSDSFVGYLGEGKNLLPGGRYRPLSQTVFNIQHSIVGEDNPLIGHLTNVILFPLAILLLFFFLRKLFRNLPSNNSFFSLPFLAALILAAHPLNTEVVANIKSLDLLLSMLLSLGVLSFSLAYVDTKKPLPLAFIFVFYVLGILAKETTATLYALVPVTILFFRRDKLKNLIPVMISMTVGILTYFLIRYQAIGNLEESTIVKELLNNPFLEADTSAQYATILYTWFVYVKLLFFPHPLTHDYYPYHIEITNWTNPSTLIATVLFIMLAALSIWHIFILLKNKETKANIYLYGFLFYLITFSVSSNIVFNIGAFMNERFIFFASTGFAISLAAFLLYLQEKVKSKWIIYILTIAIIIPLSLKTFSRNKVWKDDFTLFTTDVKTSTNSAKCNVSAGGALYERAITIKGSEKKQMLLLARKYLHKGVEIHNKNINAWILLGNVSFELGDFETGILSYDNSLKINPNHALALDNYKIYGVIACQKKHYDECITIFNKNSIQHLVKDSLSRYYLANSYLSINKTEEAKAILLKLIQQAPKYANAYNKLGELYGKHLNDLAQSEIYLLKAYEYDSSNSSILENLGVLKGFKGEFQQSIEFFEQALANGGQKKQIYQNLALTYHLMNDTENSEKYRLLADEIK